jgi:hypothetical protein
VLVSTSFYSGDVPVWRIAYLMEDLNFTVNESVQVCFSSLATMLSSVLQRVMHGLWQGEIVIRTALYPTVLFAMCNPWFVMMRPREVRVYVTCLSLCTHHAQNSRLGVYFEEDLEKSRVHVLWSLYAPTHTQQLSVALTSTSSLAITQTKRSAFQRLRGLAQWMCGFFVTPL